MHVLKITKELKNDIETNQIQLQNAICNHQAVVAKSKQYPNNNEAIGQELKEAEDKIVQIGELQATLLEKLREEYKAHQKSVKSEVVKGALEERRCSLNTSLNRARKQNLLPRARNSPSNSLSDEYESRQSPPRSPDMHPTRPNDLSQTSFLGYFRLATHELYGEMQKKRAERKRRSTANPQFLYSKGWDFFGPPMKKKRNNFLAHPPSPPNTRGRKKQELAQSTSKSPPQATNGEKATINGHRTENKSTFPPIPNLPSGLIIERISPGRVSPEAKQCIVCKQPGALSICEQCSSAFHMGCHNRPFSKPPRDCPKCLGKEGRRSTNSNSSSATSRMTITFVSPTEVSEKMRTKQELQEKHADLVAELTQLQNRHSELTISLKNQESDKETLMVATQTTEEKITQLVKFIEMIKNLVDQEAASCS